MSKFPQFKCCVSGTPDGELAQLVDSSDTVSLLIAFLVSSFVYN